MTRRVAILVHAVFPGDPRVRRQSDALLEAGYEVDVVCLRRPGDPIETIENGVRVRRLPIDRTFIGFAGHIAEYLAFTAVATWRMALEHRRRRYDLVQVAGPPDFLVLAALPERWQGVPVLLDLHEDMPAFFRDRFAHPLLRPMRPLVGAATRVSAALADELVTVHEPLRDLALARGVPAERIGVVMNSADPRVFDPSRHPRRAWMADGVLRLNGHGRNEFNFVDMASSTSPSITKQPAIAMQRVTSHEQNRRLVCAPVPLSLYSTYGGVVAENHVCIIEKTAASSGITPEFLAEILKTETLDRLFRCISGATNVSAYELMRLPLPDPKRVEVSLKAGYGMEGAVRIGFGLPIFDDQKLQIMKNNNLEEHTDVREDRCAQ